MSLRPRTKSVRGFFLVQYSGQNEAIFAGSDQRSPEKSLLAAQTYFFDDSSVYATFNPELGLHPLGLPRSGCRKNINSRSELLFRMASYLNFAHGQRRSPKSQKTPASGTLTLTR